MWWREIPPDEYPDSDWELKDAAGYHTSLDRIGTRFDSLFSATFSTPAVPEPSTMTLAALRAVGLLGRGWQRRQRA